MATMRKRHRKDGSIYWQVRYRLDGVETSKSLDEENDAAAVRELVGRIGATRALEIHGITARTTRAMTTAKWVAHHIDHLSGIERRTRHEYLGVLRNDIAPAVGAIPLDQLSRDDIARWLEAMAAAGSSGKTIANKHGLLSAAPNAAVTAGHIKSNPAAGVSLPRTEQREMRFLAHAEFATVHQAVAEYWRPMVKFPSRRAAGCRRRQRCGRRTSTAQRRPCGCRAPGNADPAATPSALRRRSGRDARSACLPRCSPSLTTPGSGCSRRRAAAATALAGPCGRRTSAPTWGGGRSRAPSSPTHNRGSTTFGTPARHG